MTDDFNEQAVERAKTDNFRLQNATEWLARSLIVAHDSIIVYLGAIVVIVLASVRVWTGAAGVSLIVILFYLRIRRRQKVFARLDNLRRELDELVETPESHYPTYREEMLPEDREFLQRYASSILYPLTVPERLIENIDADTLEHVETLYFEYKGGHIHPGDVGMGIDAGAESGCEDCNTAQQLRQHIVAALSAFEDATKRTGWDELLAPRVPHLRRAIGHHQSEAMISALRERQTRRTLSYLEKGNYGYNHELVANKISKLERQMNLGLKLQSWRKGSWEDFSQSELAAAQGLAFASPWIGFWKVSDKW
jgi:hypothetical protein